ncbi:MAG: nucleoside phosphorylase, partial [Tannerellaceae bacterium]
MARIIPASELIINADGSIFHLHLKPEQLSDHIVLVGDPERVSMVADYFDSKECEVSNREFHSITGSYMGKRISVVSHGIGTDNIDIILNELDALANIDFATRTVKPDFRQLTLVRVGTSGGLQPFVPVGTYVAAERSIGFDGVIYFYADTERVRDAAFEAELIRQLDWKLSGLLPYVVSADPSLIEQITRDDILRGVTIAANGFYGPQGRELRLPLFDSKLNE